MKHYVILLSRNVPAHDAHQVILCVSVCVHVCACTMYMYVCVCMCVCVCYFYPESSIAVGKCLTKSVKESFCGHLA